MNALDTITTDDGDLEVIEAVNRTHRSEARRRAALGALWLDSEEPGWWHDIDLDSLDLASGDSCVLGQLDHVRYDDEDNNEDGSYYDPGFTRYTNRLTPGWDDSTLSQAWRDAVDEYADRGFVRNYHTEENRTPTTYDDLTEAWRVEILDRIGG